MGTETYRYATPSEFRDRFPAVLGRSRRRVLKPNRGNGGIGVWKVALVEGPAAGDDSTVPTVDRIVRIQHAAPRDDVTENVTFGDFMDRCDQSLGGGGKLIDQAFIARITDGMVRAYLVVTAWSVTPANNQRRGRAPRHGRGPTGSSARSLRRRCTTSARPLCSLC